MNIAKLKQFAPKGLKVGYMAIELGVHPSTVSAALKRYGLHREWSLARYQKCKLQRVQDEEEALRRLRRQQASGHVRE